jgi:hypothetical protein
MELRKMIVILDAAMRFVIQALSWKGKKVSSLTGHPESCTIQFVP